MSCTWAVRCANMFDLFPLLELVPKSIDLKKSVKSLDSRRKYLVRDPSDHTILSRLFRLELVPCHVDLDKSVDPLGPRREYVIRDSIRSHRYLPLYFLELVPKHLELPTFVEILRILRRISRSVSNELLNTILCFIELVPRYNKAANFVFPPSFVASRLLTVQSDEISPVCC